MGFQQWLDAFWAGTTFDQKLIEYLRATPVAELMSTSWAWPLMETLHFIGLALLLGIVAPLDARLMGFLKGVSIGALHRLIPWAVVGFVLNLITGMMFFVGAPQQYLRNAAWWLKVAFLVLAGLNMLVFELTQRAKAYSMAPDAPTPWVFKAIGGVSLASWMLVLYWGRMLPWGENF